MQHLCYTDAAYARGQETTSDRHIFFQLDSIHIPIAFIFSGGQYVRYGIKILSPIRWYIPPRCEKEGVKVEGL